MAAAPDLVLAGAFLLAWMDPSILGASVIPYFLLTMLLEFIIVHSSAFMGTVALSRRPVGEKLKSVAGLGAFYTLFVGGFAIGFGEWWPLAAFWGLTANRMLGLLLTRSSDSREQEVVKAGWALSVAFYVVGAFATTLLPIPELGVTSGVRRAIDLPGGGLWIDEPHRVLAFGVLYFGLTGLGELRGWARSPAMRRGTHRSGD